MVTSSCCETLLQTGQYRACFQLWTLRLRHALWVAPVGGGELPHADSILRNRGSSKRGCKVQRELAGLRLAGACNDGVGPPADQMFNCGQKMHAAKINLEQSQKKQKKLCSWL